MTTTLRNPIQQLADLIAEAEQLGLENPNAMVLATTTAQGRPQSRVVLCKGADAHGIAFYTNKTSRKGHALQHTPWASATFYWRELSRQVLVDGPVVHIDDAVADDYWSSRHRGSQLGAWASIQSTPLLARQQLLDRVAELEARFGEDPIPRPPWWGGYLLQPDRVEFWAPGDFRLNVREQFSRAEDGGWDFTLLHP